MQRRGARLARRDEREVRDRTGRSCREPRMSRLCVQRGQLYLCDELRLRRRVRSGVLLLDERHLPSAETPGTGVQPRHGLQNRRLPRVRDRKLRRRLLLQLVLPRPMRDVQRDAGNLHSPRGRLDRRALVRPLPVQRRQRQLQRVVQQ